MKPRTSRDDDMMFDTQKNKKRLTPFTGRPHTQRCRQVRGRPNGYMTFMSVLIAGAVGVAVAVSVLYLGLGASRADFSLEQSGQAKALADACAEKALRALKSDLAYAGNETVELGQGTCSVGPVTQADGQYRIQASGNAGDVVRKVEAKVTPILDGSTVLGLTLVSWQEVADLSP